MRAPTTGQLSRMQAANVAAMWDTCYRLVYAAGTPDAYGQPTPATYTAAATALVCGLDQQASTELLPGTQVPLFDARLRLPVATTITHLDRIKVTKRYGASLAAALYYTIIGEPRRGPSGLLLDLNTVTDA